MKIDQLKQNFENRHIELLYYEDRLALLHDLTEFVMPHESIGIGNSKTLKELQISHHISSMSKTVFDKTLVEDKEEITKIKKLALTASCYVTGSNAITEDGKIINVDHSGNRVAAMTYGPDQVIVIVGINKVVKDEKAGIQRVLTEATPMNAKRAGIASPCSQGLGCDQCQQDVRVCNYLSVIRGQHVKGRMKVLLLNEKLGF